MAAAARTVVSSTEAPPVTYKHIVVVMEENRTWSGVGGVANDRSKGFFDRNKKFLRGALARSHL